MSDASSIEEEGFRSSPQQLRLWHLERTSPSWMLAGEALFELTGPLDGPAVHRALAEVVADHEILRTRLRVLTGFTIPLQQIGETVDFRFHEIDLSAPGPAPVAGARTDPEACFRRVLKAPVRRRRDLLSESPLTAWLIRWAPERHSLWLASPSHLLDGPSLVHLARALLEALAPGTERDDDEEVAQYADISEVFHQFLETEMDSGGEFWRRLTPVTPTTLRFPLEPPPEPGTDPSPRILAAAAPDALAERLLRWGDGDPERVKSLLLTCWLILLHRLSGERRLGVGVWVDGRNFEGLERALGPFGRYLPLRFEVKGGQNLLAVMEQVEGRLSELAEWQEYFSWEALVDDAFSDPPPSFPLTFEFVPTTVETVGGRSFRLLRSLSVYERFEMHLSCHLGEGLSLLVAHDPRVYSEAVARRFLERYLVLLAGCLDTPKAAAGDLPLLNPEERRFLAAVATTRAGDPETPVHRLFAQWAARQPEAIALEFDGARSTYGELADQVHRLAQFLMRRGVGPESRVGIAIERSPLLVATLLAVLEAGAAYVPIDPIHPSRRRAFLLRDAGIDLLLTDGAEEDPGSSAYPDSLTVIALDADPDSLAAEGSEPPEVRLHSESLAYVLYTSGSTGEPKGVMISHGGLVDYLHWCSKHYGVGPGSKTPVHSPLSFDLTVTSILGPLASGGRCVLVREEPGLEGLAQTLADGGSWALLKVTPAHLTILGELLGDRGGASVETLVVGGEALSGEQLRWWAEHAPATRVVNEYGPTEAVVGCSTWIRVAGEIGPGAVPIGRPIENARLHLVDSRLHAVAVGTPGEVLIAGPGLARGYLGRSGLTARQFLPDPFAAEPGARVYKSGDMVCWSPDGELTFLGRIDHQLKVRGVRIEPREIELTLRACPGVREAVVILRQDLADDPRLVAYLVLEAGVEKDLEGVRGFVRERLPEAMMPVHFVDLPRLPLTTNGKVDRGALPAPDLHQGVMEDTFRAPSTHREKEIAEIWCQALHLERVRLDDNFFDLGGHSLLLVDVRRKLREQLGHEVSMMELFRYPTVRSLAEFLAAEAGEEGPVGDGKPAPEVDAMPRANGDRDIAIVGMGCRLPGSLGPEEFWQNLREGVELVSFFTDEELLEAGVAPEAISHPDYVKAKAVLEDVELFDAGFFGMNPREAEITDPQHRLFLECAWEALEHAGYDPGRYPGRVGVFGGVSANSYWPRLAADGRVMAEMSMLQLTTANDKDYVPSKISYKLNLTGPSVNVQSACSTSLVAVHLACRALLNGETEMALAGGATVRLPEKAGYLYLEGGIGSPDGHCRPYDRDARGTLAGDGVGIVVLKRLQDALAEGDTIHAVIKGTAINNDGSRKVGYTAPSVEGQSAVIRAALADAGVEAGTIDYVEGHGTATVLGDPIEVMALQEAFGEAHGMGRCALGSVKSNLGHLDAAAGVAGLIKTTLALAHREIPPSLHFEEPNPEIDFSRGPFRVNATLVPWEKGEGPRRAGVSAFGIGGTNAHVIVEEAPEVPTAEPARRWQLLVFSARSPAALATMNDRLVEFLERGEEVSLADLAYTLQVGRRRFPHRRIAVCEDREDAIEVLGSLVADRVESRGPAPEQEAPLAFLFPGQGSQYAGMATELYRHEANFRELVDHCTDFLEPRLGRDLRLDIFPAEGNSEAASAALEQTWLTQPALFVIEYSLARLWMEWGVVPRAMLGHSIGEYVAACLAGVFTLEDALAVVAERGRLVQEMSGGEMLSVPLTPAELEEHLVGGISLAAINGPQLCALSGPAEKLDAVAEKLAARGVHCRPMRTSHAFHSSMLDPMLEAFGEILRGIELRVPEVPFLSNFTGTWIRDREATDPEYWVKHLRYTVRFEDNLRELLRDPDRILLEVGPGTTLCTLARRHPDVGGSRTLVSSLGPGKEPGDAQVAMLKALGGLWAAGLELDWRAFHGATRRRRIPAPTYPFERARYWIEPSAGLAGAPTGPSVAADLADWFYVPSFEKSVPPRWPRDGGDVAEHSPWLVFVDEQGVARCMAESLRERGIEVLEVSAGDGFAEQGEGCWKIDPRTSEDYLQLFACLASSNRMPKVISHLWSVTGERWADAPSVPGEPASFFGLLYLAQALGQCGDGSRICIGILSDGVHTVSGSEVLEPTKATLLGPCRTIPSEMPHVACRNIDITLEDLDRRGFVDHLLAEHVTAMDEPVVAYRGGYRFVETFERVRLPPTEGGTPELREGGVYLITGGLGGMGLDLAVHLARTMRARLVLVNRTPFPASGEWAEWLETHDGTDRTSRRIRRLQEVEAAGGEAFLVTADVTDREAMARVVAAAVERFGAVHGAIHAAGVPPSGMLLLKTPEQAAEGLAAKVRGTLVLSEVLAEQEPDFLVLCSSLSSVLGQAGRIDYVAANAFQEAFAEACFRRDGMPTVAIAWDTWREVGMAFDLVLERGGDPRTMIQLGMTSVEGAEVLARALHAGMPRFLVSIGDLETVREQERRSWGSAAAEERVERTPRRGHPRPELATPYVAPGNDVEKTICAIWEAMLGIDQVGIHDNFFDLGGDSVITIQILARLNQTGLALTPKQVFDGQTVAELAAMAGTGAVVRAEQGLVTGDLPLTPIQCWFFEQDLPHREHFNQAMMLEVREPLELPLLARVAGHLERHHDVLRLRFEPTEGGWRQTVSVPGEALPFLHVDLGGLPKGRRRKTLEEVAEVLQASLDLVQGPIFRFAFLDLGREQTGRLLIVIHHLAVDAVSWRFLLEDLALGYQHLRGGEGPRFPQKTTSFKEWSRRLVEHARDPAVVAELDYWLDDSAKVQPLPTDCRTEDNTISSRSTVAVTLDAESTRFLLQEISQLFRVQITDVLLTALAQAMRSFTGSDSLLVDLEGHGRDPIFDDLDISRTLGWFTTLFPVLLDLGSSGDPGVELKAVKETLRRMPARGIGYGLLRYLHPGGDEEVERLRRRPRAGISFLYLGQLDQAVDSSSSFRPASEAMGSTQDPGAPCPYVFEVGARVIEQKLLVHWIYSDKQHDRGTVERLAERYLEALRVLIDYCRAADDVGYTPSDFAKADLEQAELDEILDSLNRELE